MRRLAIAGAFAVTGGAVGTGRTLKSFAPEILHVQLPEQAVQARMLLRLVGREVLSALTLDV